MTGSRGTGAEVGLVGDGICENEPTLGPGRRETRQRAQQQPASVEWGLEREAVGGEVSEAGGAGLWRALWAAARGMDSF